MARRRMIVWQGLSELDGKTPIVLLATYAVGGGTVSANAKTGEMIQTWVLVDDIAPLEVLRRGLDRIICGVCPHVSVAAGGSGACYVNVGQAPRSIWKAYNDRGRVPGPRASDNQAFDLTPFMGAKLRIGSYGDPAAVPFHVWDMLASAASLCVGPNGRPGGNTGYTHQWKTADSRFSRFLMASADNPHEGKDARAAGYRSFIVRAPGEAKPAGSVTCPASAEAGKRTVCSSCMQCGGSGNGRTADISIVAHGSTARRFVSLPLSVVRKAS